MNNLIDIKFKGNLCCGDIYDSIIVFTIKEKPIYFIINMLPESRWEIQSNRKSSYRIITLENIEIISSTMSGTEMFIDFFSDISMTGKSFAMKLNNGHFLYKCRIQSIDEVYYTEKSILTNKIVIHSGV